MLKLFGRANSINVQKVLWTCEELQVPVERTDLGGSFGGLETHDYLRMNPNKLVPTIEDEGTVVWESNAIVRYLAAKHGAGSLWPTVPEVRASSDKWMDWQLTTYWPDVRTMFVQLIRTREEQRNAQLIEDARVKAVAAARTLNDALADTTFLAGGSLTIGDIAAGVVTHRFLALDIERPTLVHLEAWYDRLTQREGFRRYVMLPLS
jgi:glutathione S-transferase